MLSHKGHWVTWINSDYVRPFSHEKVMHPQWAEKNDLYDLQAECVAMDWARTGLTQKATFPVSGKVQQMYYGSTSKNKLT